MSDDKFDEGFAAPPSNWVKWGKIGDRIKGKLISVGEKDDSFNPGKRIKVYELEAETGTYHDSEGAEFTVEAGEIIMVSGKKIIDQRMARCKIGQRCTMEYTGDYKKPEGGFAAKTIEVKLDSSFKAPEPAAGEEIPFK